jgi:branched-chain amino acid transport system substrate-binding protein
MAFAEEPEFDLAFYTTPWHPAIGTAESLAFVAAFRKSYGAAPSDVAATSYDATTLLLAAMERAGSTDADAIRQALRGMPPLSGVTGTISYRGSGDPTKSAVVVQIHRGSTAVYAVVEP